MIQNKMLLDLPVLPEDRDEAGATSIVQDAYIKESLAIATVEDLRAFTNRWANIWLLAGKQSQELRPEEKALASGEYVAEELLAETFRCRCRIPDAKPDDNPLWNSLAMFLIMPEAMIKAFQLSTHYNVGHDLALVRLYLDPHDPPTGETGYKLRKC